jgi:micrococcal nuclease
MGAREVVVVVSEFDMNDKRLWYYRCKITRVIDGDTVEAQVDCGFGNKRTERLRLAGVDAPELRPRRGTPEEREEERQEAAKAKDRVTDLLHDRECVIRTFKTGSFGRWIATIFFPEDVITQLAKVASGEPSKSINDLLLAEGLAQPYPARHGS